MASAKKIEANRRNAKKSTGPRTAAGKQRASGNAYRHGLTSRAILSGADIQQLEELADALADNSESPLKRGWARTAAEAMFDLARVQQVKLAWLNRAFRNHTNAPINESGHASEQDAAASVAIVLPKLLALFRYEQRCCSRRDRAFQQILQIGEND